MGNNETKFLDGLRIILALWVGLGHLYEHIGSENLIKFPLWHVLKYNSPAVDGFMVITGFLMMYNYSQRKKSEPPQLFSTKIKFYKRRFFRLYPLYFSVILTSYFLFPVINDLYIQMHDFFIGGGFSSYTYGNGKSVDLIDLFSHLTFIHGFIPGLNTSISGPAWSLSTEIQFYAIFPFLFLMLKKPKNLVALLFFSLSIYWISFKLLGLWDTPGRLLSFGSPSLLFQKLVYFSLGISLANYKLGNDRIGILLLNLLLIALLTDNYISALLCLIITTLMISRDIDAYMPQYINTPIRLLKKILSGKTSAFGAKISYSFYLIHNLIIPLSFIIAKTYGNNDKKFTALLTVPVFLILTIAISYLLFLIIEKPFTKFGKRIILGDT